MIYGGNLFDDKHLAFLSETTPKKKKKKEKLKCWFQFKIRNKQISALEKILYDFSLSDFVITTVDLSCKSKSFFHFYSGKTKPI